MSVVDHFAVPEDARQQGAAPEAPLGVLIGLPRVSPQIELRPADPVTELAVTATVAAGLLDLLVDLTTVPALLTAISTVAVDVVPQCAAACVGMVRDGAPAMVASDDEQARHVDEIQYRTGEGPYLHAAQTGQAVQIDDITAEPGDYGWRRAALEAGFTAVLSVPLASDGNVAAVINLYSRDGGAWSQQSVQAAEILADHAWSAIMIATAGAGCCRWGHRPDLASPGTGVRSGTCGEQHGAAST